MTREAEALDAFPYPERDPADETARLITGSPGDPVEIDHFLFAGMRDWSIPLRVLIADGGTGDTLIQLAQRLTSAGRPYQITYLARSRSAGQLAEARAAARGLRGIVFQTGSLLEACALGPFDYVDCCGLLHHLPDPRATVAALATALAPEGGIGLMVHAPFGRSGVQLLQDALGPLLTGTPRDRLRRARAILDRLPEGHPLVRNLAFADQLSSDAGLYDLLLRAPERPVRIGALIASLAQAGLVMTGSPQAYLYDPVPILGDRGLVHGLDGAAQMDLAEALRGTIRAHVLYAAREVEGRVAQPGPQAIAHLKGVTGPKLMDFVLKQGVIPVTHDGQRAEIAVPAMAVRALGQIDGRRSMTEIAQAVGTDWAIFGPVWTGLSHAMSAHGLLFYSRLLVDEAAP
jgi:SAM-dependent methyltransferase